MDVARLNMSHGDHSVHEQTYATSARPPRSWPPGRDLADLQGPKIRLGRFADGPHPWRSGTRFTITTDDVEGTGSCSTTYKGLPGDVRPATRC